MLQFYLHINFIILTLQFIFDSTIQGGGEMIRTCFVGDQEYEEVVRSPCFFDKTLLVKEFLLQPEPSIHLVTEPHRFGKTVNMRMIKSFLETFQENSSDSTSSCQIFITNSLNIFMDNETFFYEHCGQYPVIHISFQNINGNNFEDILYFIKRIVEECFSQHNYLLESAEISKYQKIVIAKYFNKESVPIIKLKKYILEGVRLLCQMLFHHFFRRVTILIDDFDDPIWSIIRGDFKGDIDDYLDFIVDFNKALLTNNLYLGRALVNTGGRTSTVLSRQIGSIARLHLQESHQFVGYYGLTQDEVRRKLSELNVLDIFEDVKDYYSGYESGNLSSVYGLSSIIRFFDTKAVGKYWMDPAEFNKLDELFLQEERLRDFLIILLSGKEVQIEADLNMKFYDILDLNQIVSGIGDFHDDQTERILQLLSDKGYLTFRHKNKFILLRIPNEDTYQHLFHSVYSESFSNRNFNFSDDNIHIFLQSMNYLATDKNKTVSLLRLAESLTNLYRDKKVPDSKEELQSSIYYVIKKSKDMFFATNMEVTIPNNLYIWKDDNRKRIKNKRIKKAARKRVNLVTIRKRDETIILIKINVVLDTVEGSQKMHDEMFIYNQVFQTQDYKTLGNKGRIFLSVCLNSNTSTFLVRYLNDIII